ncbi:MAG: hypothetical protein AAFY98_11370 [Verrucomicrobiota bacterium]
MKWWLIGLFSVFALFEPVIAMEVHEEQDRCCMDSSAQDGSGEQSCGMDFPCGCADSVISVQMPFLFAQQPLSLPVVFSASATTEEPLHFSEISFTPPSPPPRAFSLISV